MKSRSLNSSCATVNTIASNFLIGNFFVDSIAYFTLVIGEKFAKYLINLKIIIKVKKIFFIDLGEITQTYLKVKTF